MRHAVHTFNIFTRYASIIQALRIVHKFPQILGWGLKFLSGGTVKGSKKALEDRGHPRLALALAIVGGVCGAIDFVVIVAFLFLAPIVALTVKLATLSLAGSLNRDVRNWSSADWVAISQVVMNIISLADSSVASATERRNGIVTAIIGICYDDNSDADLTPEQWAVKVNLFNEWLVAGYLRKRGVWGSMWLAMYTPWSDDLVRLYDFPQYAPQDPAARSADKDDEFRKPAPIMKRLACGTIDKYLVDNFCTEPEADVDGGVVSTGKPAARPAPAASGAAAPAPADSSVVVTVVGAETAPDAGAETRL